MARGLLAVAMLAAALATPLGAQETAAAPAPGVEGFASRMQAIAERPEFRHARWGVQVLDVATGETLYSRNGGELFVAASTTKLLTEGTALALLGRDHRFHTRIVRTGAVSRRGVLRGDLVLVASGDPNLSARVRPDDTLAFEDEDHAYGGTVETRAVPGDPLAIVRRLAAQVARHGIRTVRGRVLVDDTLFASGDRELGTGVVISPIVVNDNVVDLTIGPGAQPGAAATLRVAPATAYLRFVNRMTTGPAGSHDETTVTAEVARPDGSLEVTLGGSYPADRPPVLDSYAVPSPAEFARAALTQALAANGVVVKPPRHAAPPDFAALAKRVTPGDVVAEHVSPPFAEEVRVTLKVSQNLHASLTPRLLAALLGKDGSQTGFDLERDFLGTLGLDLAGAQQADGAGGNARFTPDFMVRYLAAMARRPEFEDLRRALPVLGRDGTLHDIQPASPAAGKVTAKTGTFSLEDPLNRRTLVTAKALAGYTTAASGRSLAFAIFLNDLSVATKANEIKRVAGQTVGEVAAAIWESF